MSTSISPSPSSSPSYLPTASVAPSSAVLLSQIRFPLSSFPSLSPHSQNTFYSPIFINESLPLPSKFKSPSPSSPSSSPRILSIPTLPPTSSPSSPLPPSIPPSSSLPITHYQSSLQSLSSDIKSLKSLHVFALSVTSSFREFCANEISNHNEKDKMEKQWRNIVKIGEFLDFCNDGIEEMGRGKGANHNNNLPSVSVPVLTIQSDGRTYESMSSESFNHANNNDYDSNKTLYPPFSVLLSRPLLLSSSIESLLVCESLLAIVHEAETHSIRSSPSSLSVISTLKFLLSPLPNVRSFLLNHYVTLFSRCLSTQMSISSSQRQQSNTKSKATSMPPWLHSFNEFTQSNIHHNHHISPYSFNPQLNTNNIPNANYSEFSPSFYLRSLDQVYDDSFPPSSRIPYASSLIDCQKEYFRLRLLLLPEFISWCFPSSPSPPSSLSPTISESKFVELSLECLHVECQMAGIIFEKSLRKGEEEIHSSFASSSLSSLVLSAPQSKKVSLLSSHLSSILDGFIHKYISLHQSSSSESSNSHPHYFSLLSSLRQRIFSSDFLPPLSLPSRYHVFLSCTNTLQRNSLPHLTPSLLSLLQIPSDRSPISTGIINQCRCFVDILRKSLLLIEISLAISHVISPIQSFLKLIQSIDKEIDQNLNGNANSPNPSFVLFSYCLVMMDMQEIVEEIGGKSLIGGKVTEGKDSSAHIGLHSSPSSSSSPSPSPPSLPSLSSSSPSPSSNSFGSLFSSTLSTVGSTIGISKLWGYWGGLSVEEGKGEGDGDGKQNETKSSPPSLQLPTPIHQSTAPNASLSASSPSSSTSLLSLSQLILDISRHCRNVQSRVFFSIDKECRAMTHGALNRKDQEEEDISRRLVSKVKKSIEELEGMSLSAIFTTPNHISLSLHIALPLSSSSHWKKFLNSMITFATEAHKQSVHDGDTEAQKRYFALLKAMQGAKSEHQ